MAPRKPISLTEARESYAGYHFYDLFNTCKRKFYIKYGLGYRPTRTKSPLAFGSAFHGGKAEWYRTRSKPKALKAATEQHQVFRGGYDNERFALDAERLVILLDSWIEERGRPDLVRYRIIEVEQQHKVTLPNGFVLTFRCDAFVQDKGTGACYLMETKTTGWSASGTVSAVEMGDQATLYLWGMKQVAAKLGLRIRGVIPDVSYWNKQSHNPLTIQHRRGDLVMRTQRDLVEFELYTVDTLVDIAQRMRGVMDGTHHPLMAFGRCTAWCNSFSSPCEYADICRTWLTAAHVPSDFTRDPWKKRSELLAMDQGLLRLSQSEAPRLVYLTPPRKPDPFFDSLEYQLLTPTQRKAYEAQPLFTGETHAKTGYKRIPRRFRVRRGGKLRRRDSIDDRQRKRTSE